MSLFFLGRYPNWPPSGRTVNRRLSGGQSPVRGIFSHPARKMTLQNRSGRDRTGRSDGLHPRNLGLSAGVLEYNGRGIPPVPCPWYGFFMFDGSSAGGRGERPGTGQTSSRKADSGQGALRGGIGSCQGVRQRAVSSHPAIFMHKNCNCWLILRGRRQPGAGGRIASVFPCPAAAAGHWPAAAAIKPTGPPSPPGTPIGSFWGRSGKPHAPAARDGSFWHRPSAGQGGDNLRADQDCKPHSSRANMHAMGG